MKDFKQCHFNNFFYATKKVKSRDIVCDILIFLDLDVVVDSCVNDVGGGWHTPGPRQV